MLIALVALLATIAAATFGALFSIGTLDDTVQEMVEVASVLICDHNSCELHDLFVSLAVAEHEGYTE